MISAACGGAGRVPFRGAVHAGHDARHDAHHERPSFKSGPHHPDPADREAWQISTSQFAKDGRYAAAGVPRMAPRRLSQRPSRTAGLQHLCLYGRRPPALALLVVVTSVTASGRWDAARPPISIPSPRRTHRHSNLTGFHEGKGGRHVDLVHSHLHPLRAPLFKQSTSRTAYPRRSPGAKPLRKTRPRRSRRRRDIPGPR